MKHYLIDTNVIVISLRRGLGWSNTMTRFNISEHNSAFFISVVSIGELYALALKNNWGMPRVLILEEIISQFVIIDINHEGVLRQYAEIDAYSQGKHPRHPLNSSARNMGKNDLWIAATASAFDLTLLTTDQDFDHIPSEIFQQIRL